MHISYSPITSRHFPPDKSDFLSGRRRNRTFVHNPSPDPTYEYNVLVYSSTDLDNAPHSIIISTSGITPSVLLFDYFNYT